MHKVNHRSESYIFCEASHLLFYVPQFRIQSARLDLGHNNVALILKCTAAITLFKV